MKNKKLCKMKNKKLIIIIMIISLIIITIGGIFLFNHTDLKKKESEKFVFTQPIEKLEYDLDKGNISKSDYIKQFTYMLYDNSKLSEEYKGVNNDPLLFSVYVDRISSMFDTLKEEEKQETANIILSKGAFQADGLKKQNVTNDYSNNISELSLSNKIINVDNTSSGIDYTKVKVSEDGKFIIWYNTDASNPTSISDELAEETLMLFSEKTNEMLEYYNSSWTFNSANTMFQNQKQAWINVLNENGIYDEKILDTAFPIYVAEMEGTAVGGYMPMNLFLEIAKYLSIIFPQEIPYYSAPLFQINPNYINDIKLDMLLDEENYKKYIQDCINMRANLEIVITHEMFHHFQAQVLTKNDLNNLSGELFPTEMTANYTAAKLFDPIKATNVTIKRLEKKNFFSADLLNMYKNTDSVSDTILNGHAGISVDSHRNGLDSIYKIHKGYQAFIFAELYSNLVKDGENKLMKTFNNKNSLCMLYNNSGGKFGNVMLEYAEKILTQDFSKNIYKSSKEKIESMSKLCTNNCDKGSNIEHTSMHYYTVNPADYSNNKKLYFFGNSTNLKLLVLGKHNNEYTELLEETLNKKVSISTNSMIKSGSLYYDEVIFIVVNIACSAELEYSYGLENSTNTTSSNNEKLTYVGSEIKITPESGKYKYTSNNSKLLIKVNNLSLKDSILKLLGEEYPDNKFKAKAVGNTTVSIDKGKSKEIKKVKIVSKKEYIDIDGLPSKIIVGKSGKANVLVNSTILELLLKKYDSVKSSDSSILKVSATNLDLRSKKFKYNALKEGVVTVTVKKGKLVAKKTVTVISNKKLKDYVSQIMDANSSQAVCINHNKFDLKSANYSKLEVVKATYNSGKVTTEEGIVYNNLINGSCNETNIYVIRAYKTSLLGIELSLYQNDTKVSNASILIKNNDINIGALDKNKLIVNDIYDLHFDIDGIDKVDMDSYKVYCKVGSSFTILDYEQTLEDEDANGIVEKDGKIKGYCKIRTDEVGQSPLVIDIFNSRNMRVASNSDYLFGGNNMSEKIEHFVSAKADKYTISSSKPEWLNYDNLFLQKVMVRNKYNIDNNNYNYNGKLIINNDFSHNILKNISNFSDLELLKKQSEIYKYLPIFKVYNNSIYFIKSGTINQNLSIENHIVENRSIYIEEPPEIIDIDYDVYFGEKIKTCANINLDLVNHLNIFTDIYNNICDSSVYKYYQDLIDVYNDKNGMIKTYRIKILSDNSYKKSLMSATNNNFSYYNGDIYINASEKYNNMYIPYLAAKSADDFVAAITGEPLSSKYKKEIKELFDSMSVNGKSCFNNITSLSNSNDYSNLMAYMYAYVHLKEKGEKVDFINENACNYSLIKSLWDKIESDYIKSYVE